MKLLLKILLFVLVIFQTNICEAKVFVLSDIILEPTISNTFNSEKSDVKFENVFLENDLAKVRVI
jgi:hypothetical protein